MNYKVFASAFLFSIGAQASTYTCTEPDMEGPPAYKLQFGAGEQGNIYQMNTYHDWELLYDDASVFHAADGGPTVISGVDRSSVDWSQQTGCYKVMKPSLRFTLRTSTVDNTAELQLTPHVEVQPNVDCAVPRLARPAARELVCEPEVEAEPKRFRI